MTRGSTEISKRLAVILGLVIVCSGIQAYAIGPIPTTWITNQGFIYIAALLAVRRQRLHFPGAWVWMLFVAWMSGVTLISIISAKYVDLMPAETFLSYESYIALRIFNLFLFLCTVASVFAILRSDHSDALIGTIVWGATILCIFAIYIYIAQVLELLEPPRTRIGTGGVEQGITFSHQFHRAMGATREPSHLAEWLVLPITLCILYSQRTKYLHVALQLLVLLLTGSLLGILGLSLGVIAALSASRLWFAITVKESQFLKKALLAVGVVIPIAVGTFYLVAAPTEGDAPELLGPLWERFAPIMEEGNLRATNRDYTYEFLDTKETSLVGEGLGHPNLELSQQLGIPVVASLLSLYSSVLLSGGWIGLALLASALLQPVVRLIKLGQLAVPRLSPANTVFVGYAGWLFMFGAHEDELSVMFGVAYGFLSFAIYQRDRIGVPGRSGVAWGGRPTIEARNSG